MNPIEFGAELFAKAKEMQTKTVRAMEVIAKIDTELDSMPEPFKMDFMSVVTKAIDKCENKYIAPKQKITLFCSECGITEMNPLFGQKYCRYCGTKFKD